MENNRLDINSTKSERRGFSGLLETLLRNFRTTTFMLLLVAVYMICILCMGIALAPSVVLFNWVSEHTVQSPPWLRALSLGLTIATGFFLYGFTLILVVPLANKLFPFKVKTQRATWFSLSVIPWYFHNALTYLVRYTFLDFITPTPINKFYFQMMGMKVGKGGIINTCNISDPCLIHIGDNVTIGLGACLFGNVVVGKNAVVRPHQVVLPKSRIPGS